MGLVGARARGNESPWHPVELFITRPFEEAEDFARELSRTAYLAVHLYAFDLVPWAHPLHLCVRWLNVDAIPVMECPRGAITRWQMEHNGNSVEASVLLESLPHFRPGQKFVSTRTFQKSGEFVRMFGPPPIGGFLMQP